MPGCHRAIHTTFPTAEVEELCLDQEALLPLHSDTLAQRHALEVAQALTIPCSVMPGSLPPPM